MRKISVCLFLLFSILNANGQTINSADSKVSFDVSNMAFNTVEGTFTGMKGKVQFTPDDLTASKFDVCIDASSVNTGNEKRDKHLRNKDFFDVEKYPTICFSSTEIKKYSSGYTAIGILEMHGVTKTIEIPFTFKNKELVGNFKIKRKDFKVGESTGGFMVGKQIKLQINCVLK